MYQKVRFASHFFDRAIGLLKERDPNQILALIPCSSIHTFFMKAPIDVAFVSKEGIVVYSERNVLPGRLIKNMKAQYVLERISSCEEEWVSEGSHIYLSEGKV